MIDEWDSRPQISLSLSFWELADFSEEAVMIITDRDCLTGSKKGKYRDLTWVGFSPSQKGG